MREVLEILIAWVVIVIMFAIFAEDNDWDVPASSTLIHETDPDGLR